MTSPCPQRHLHATYLTKPMRLLGLHLQTMRLRDDLCGATQPQGELTDGVRHRGRPARTRVVRPVLDLPVTTAAKVAGTALALTAVVVVGTIGGLVLMIHTRERKITTWAGDSDE